MKQLNNIDHNQLFANPRHLNEGQESETDQMVEIQELTHSVHGFLSLDEVKADSDASIFGIKNNANLLVQAFIIRANNRVIAEENLSEQKSLVRNLYLYSIEERSNLALRLIEKGIVNEYLAQYINEQPFVKFFPAVYQALNLKS